MNHKEISSFTTIELIKSPLLVPIALRLKSIRRISHLEMKHVIIVLIHGVVVDENVSLLVHRPMANHPQLKL